MGIVDAPIDSSHAKFFPVSPDSIVLLCAALWSLVLYGSLIHEDPKLYLDDREFIDYLQGILNLKNYFANLMAFKTIDLQPVRDALFVMDRSLSSVLGFGTFHWTNTVLWVLCLGLVWRLLRRVHGPGWLVAFAVGLMALHPITVGSVAWISARKHLASFLFLLLATDILVSWSGTRRDVLRVSLLCSLTFSLSVLSHPISCWWPVWACLYLYGRGQVRSPLNLYILVLPLLIMGGTLLANHYYYSVRPEFHKLPVSFDATSTALALGRYWMNLFVPIRLALTYSIDSILNTIGIVLIPLSAFIMQRLMGFRTLALWLGFALMPLLLMTIPQSNIFVSDTYALASLFAVANLSIYALKAIPPSWQRFGILALSCLGGFFLLSDLEIAKSWHSDPLIWERSLYTEPTPTAYEVHSRFLLEEGRVLESLSLARSEWAKLDAHSATWTRSLHTLALTKLEMFFNGRLHSSSMDREMLAGTIEAICKKTKNTSEKCSVLEKAITLEVQIGRLDGALVRKAQLSARQQL